MHTGKERALNKRARDQPGSQRGSCGDLGGSTDAHWSYLPIAGKYGAQGGSTPPACLLPQCTSKWAPSQEAGELGTQSSLGSHTPRQWVGVPHTRPPIPRYPPRTPAESQGRRLARQKSLSPLVPCLFPSQKTRFRQFFPCETTSRTLNRGRTSSVSGSIGPCMGSLNSQDTHHVRDALGLAL